MISIDYVKVYKNHYIVRIGGLDGDLWRKDTLKEVKEDVKMLKALPTEYLYQLSQSVAILRAMEKNVPNLSETETLDESITRIKRLQRYLDILDKEVFIWKEEE